MYTGGGIVEFRMSLASDLNTVADVTGAKWGPAFQPMYVIGVAAILQNVIAAAGVLKFDKRPTFGSDAGRGDGDVGVLNFATAQVGGNVVYKLVTPIKISPGQEVVAEVTDATGAADTADIVLLLSPSPEVPGNIAAMIAST